MSNENKVVLPEPVQDKEANATSKEEYRRMFIAACSDLGLINEALDLDPDDGGAEPILEAIAELKALASIAAPAAVAVADEREAFADWLVRSYPADYTKAEALRLWHHGDIAALAWEHRAALAATPADHIADAGKMVAAPVRMPEPVAFALEWTFNGEERGMRLYDDETHCRFDAESDGGVCHPLYTEQQVRALLATATAPTEPFGY